MNNLEVVSIRYDQPNDENWLCPENIELALSSYCINTKFKVERVLGWIDAKINPPENSGCYLIYSADGLVAEGEYSKETEEWVQFRWSVKNQNVAYWMPLPEPPKE